MDSPGFDPARDECANRYRDRASPAKIHQKFFPPPHLAREMSPVGILRRFRRPRQRTLDATTCALALLGRSLRKEITSSDT